MARTWDLIPERTVEEIRDLAALDDLASHRDPGVSPEQARDYLARVKRVLNTLGDS